MPKYDGNGASVRYTVSEVFVDDMGNVQDVTAAGASDSYKAVAKVWQEYRASTTVGEYQVGENHVLDLSLIHISPLIMSFFQNALRNLGM